MRVWVLRGGCGGDSGGSDVCEERVMRREPWRTGSAWAWVSFSCGMSPLWTVAGSWKKALRSRLGRPVGRMSCHLEPTGRGLWGWTVTTEPARSGESGGRGLLREVEVVGAGS